jgi:hypothetical protein
MSKSKTVTAQKPRESRLGNRVCRNALRSNLDDTLTHCQVLKATRGHIRTPMPRETGTRSSPEFRTSALGVRGVFASLSLPKALTLRCVWMLAIAPMQRDRRKILCKAEACLGITEHFIKSMGRFALEPRC